MALTQRQIDELNATYGRTGGQTPEDLANIEYAKTQGYTPPIVPIVPAPPVTSTPTVKEAYSSVLTPKTPEELAYEEELKRQSDIDKGLATGEVDEATIRANTEKMFQSEIDALNKVYAEKRRELGVQGQGRLGESTSLQARRGLIGSDFGAAQTEGVRSYNQQILDEAEAERAAKESNIRAAARGLATQEYQSKLAAKQQGAEAYLEFLKGAAERKANTVKQTVANMLSDNVDIDKLDSEGLAKDLGISVAELKRQYNESKKIIDEQKAIAEAEAQKAELEAIKSGSFNLSEGQSRFVYNPLTGETTEIASKGKTYKTTGKNSGGGTGTNTIGGGLSSTAEAVLSGVLRLEDLTPTERGKIAGELTKAGYKSNTKLSTSQQEDLSTMGTVEDLISQIQDYNLDGKLEGIGGFKSGSIQSFFTKNFGTGSDEAKDVRSLIGNIKGTIAKLRGGTSFTPNEEKLLESYTPTIDESASSILSKLNNLKNFITTKRENTIQYATERILPNTKQSSQVDLRTKYNY